MREGHTVNKIGEKMNYMRKSGMLCFFGRKRTVIYLLIQNFCFFSKKMGFFLEFSSKNYISPRQVFCDSDSACVKPDSLH